MNAKNTEEIEAPSGRKLAHEFNNLLTVIMGNFSLLRHGRLDSEEKEEVLAETDKALERARELTDAIRRLHRCNTTHH